MDDYNEFLMAGGVPPFKFDQPGDQITGFISQVPQRQHRTDPATGALQYWDPPANTQPQYQLRVVLMTDLHDDSIPDDSGERAIYIRGQMLQAVRQAAREAGSPEGIQVGGKLRVTFTGLGEAKRSGLNAPKLYSALYRKPEAPATPVPDGPPAAAAQPTTQAPQVADEVPF